MIKQGIERGIRFDWFGGAGLYRHNIKLCNGPDELGLFFVMDIHKNEKNFLQEPSFKIPEAQTGREESPRN